MRLDLNPENALLLIIDVQEKLAGAMHPRLYERLVANLQRLGQAAALLKLPVVITEQYPKGLGSTVEPVRSAFAGAIPMAKMDFDACADLAIRDALAAQKRSKAIVAGMETHICVFQTVRALARASATWSGRPYEVHVLRDAVASRTEENYEVGLGLCRDAGAAISSTETALFDLVGRAGSDAFKAVSKLVR